MMPRVFISYSHDSDAYRQRVGDLAESLRESGLAVHLDLDEKRPAGPVEGWRAWMRHQIEQSDYVLVLITENYRKRFLKEESPGTGRGATWEGAIITEQLYGDSLRNTKFVPAGFGSATANSTSVPPPLDDWTYYDLTTDYQELLGRLLGQTQPAASARPVLFHETDAEQQWAPMPATRIGAFSRAWALSEKRRAVSVLRGGPITFGQLAGARCLILTMGPSGTTELKAQELDIRLFVQLNDGGLLLLGTYLGEPHHRANLNALAERYGMSLNEDVVMPKGSNSHQARWGQLVEPVGVEPAGAEGGPNLSHDPKGRRIQQAIVRGVGTVQTAHSCSIHVDAGAAASLLGFGPPVMLFDVHYADRQRGLIDDTQEVPDASGCVMAASTTFKVVLAGGWKTFANEFLGAGSSNNQLFRNVINWLCR